MKDYGDILGRLVCMYLRMINEESEVEWEHGLTEKQLEKLDHISECLEQEFDNEDELDGCFHALLKELFFWRESHKINGGIGMSDSAISGICKHRTGGQRFHQCTGDRKTHWQVIVWHQSVHIQ
jgi:hypothetical protein